MRGETCSFDVIPSRPHTMIFPGGVAPDARQHGASESMQSDEDEGVDASDGDVDVADGGDDEEPDDTAWAAGFSAPDVPGNKVDADGIPVPEIDAADFDMAADGDVGGDGLSEPECKKRRKGCMEYGGSPD